MKIVIKSRGGGKSAYLIKRSIETQIPIVVTRRSSIDDLIKSSEMVKKLMNIDLPFPTPIFYEDLIRNNRGRARNVLVDNLPTMIEQILGSRVSEVTCSSEEVLFDFSNKRPFDE